MTYVLFETDWIIPHGILRRNDTPVLVMIHEAEDQITLSVADPDLRLPKRRNMAYLDREAEKTPAQPSTVRLSLRGQWRLADPQDDIVLRRYSTATILELHCHHGLTWEAALLRD